MRIGVFSNAWSARQGGGVAEIAAYANVLREFGSVELNFLARITAEEIKELFDPSGLLWVSRSFHAFCTLRLYADLHFAELLAKERCPGQAVVETRVVAGWSSESW